MSTTLNLKKILWTAMLAVCASSILAGSTRGTIGDVVQSAQTSVNGSSVPSEWTLATGDQVTTGASGKALIRLSSQSDLRLAENTSVTFGQGPGNVTASLAAGTVGAESASRQGLVVKTALCTLEPAGQGSSAYWIQVSPDQTVVSANRGAVKIIEVATGAERIVPEGHHALISQAPDDQPPPSGIPQSSDDNRKRLILISVLAGLAALGVGLGVWAALHSSSSGPASPSQP